MNSDLSRAGPAKRGTAASDRTGILGVSVVSRQHPAHVLLFGPNHTKTKTKIKLVSGIFLWHVFQMENMPKQHDII